MTRTVDRRPHRRPARRPPRPRAAPPAASRPAGRRRPHGQHPRRVPAPGVDLTGPGPGAAGPDQLAGRRPDDRDATSLLAPRSRLKAPSPRRSDAPAVSPAPGRRRTHVGVPAPGREETRPHFPPHNLSRRWPSGSRSQRRPCGASTLGLGPRGRLRDRLGGRGEPGHLWLGWVGGGMPADWSRDDRGLSVSAVGVHPVLRLCPSPMEVWPGLTVVGSAAVGVADDLVGGDDALQDEVRHCVLRFVAGSAGVGVMLDEAARGRRG